MEINKATVKELYETVRRLREMMMEQRREIKYLEGRVNNLEKKFYQNLYNSLNLDSKGGKKDEI